MNTTLLDKQLFADKSAQHEAGYIPAAILKNARELGIYVLFKAGVSAGVVLVEGAHADDFTGTWATLATINWAAANRVHFAAVTGVHKAVRVRISTAIAEGVADAWAVAN
jgi:hypothetical protein